MDQLQAKIKSYKKQIEEAEEIAALNLAKYRQVSQLITTIDMSCFLLDFKICVLAQCRCSPILVRVVSEPTSTSRLWPRQRSLHELPPWNPSRVSFSFFLITFHYQTRNTSNFRITSLARKNRDPPLLPLYENFFKCPSLLFQPVSPLCHYIFCLG